MFKYLIPLAGIFPLLLVQDTPLCVCPLMEKHPVLLLHGITDRNPINNSLGARATGSGWLCLLESAFKCNKALQSHTSALPRSSRAGPGDKPGPVKCGDECVTPHSWDPLILAAQRLLETLRHGNEAVLLWCLWMALPFRKDYTGVEKRGRENIHRKGKRGETLCLQPAPYSTLLAPALPP